MRHRELPMPVQDGYRPASRARLDPHQEESRKAQARPSKEPARMRRVQGLC